MRTFVSILLFMGCLALAGCDPAIKLQPADWDESHSGSYVRKFDEFDIEMGRIGNLIGMTSSSAGGCIYNRGKSPAIFRVDNATLVTATGRYDGYDRLGNSNGNAFTQPDSCTPFDIKFDFKTTLDRALREPAHLNLSINENGKLTNISIPMVNWLKKHES